MKREEARRSEKRGRKVSRTCRPVVFTCDCANQQTSMEVYYEKREYPEGTQYLPVMQPVSGSVYYVMRMDHQNRQYYTQAPTATTAYSGASYGTYTPAAAPSYASVQPSQPQVVVMAGGSPQQSPEVQNAMGLHLGITITALFFPTLLYLIGYPFCFVKLRDLCKRSTNPETASRMSAYSGVGWFTWVLHLGFFLALCTFYIPTNCYTRWYSSYYSYWVCDYYGWISLAVFGPLTWIFTLVTIIIGASLCNYLQRTGVDQPIYVRV